MRASHFPGKRTRLIKWLNIDSHQVEVPNVHYKQEIHKKIKITNEQVYSQWTQLKNLLQTWKNKNQTVEPQHHIRAPICSVEVLREVLGVSVVGEREIISGERTYWKPCLWEKISEPKSMHSEVSAFCCALLPYQNTTRRASHLNGAMRIQPVRVPKETTQIRPCSHPPLHLKPDSVPLNLLRHPLSISKR